MLMLLILTCFILITITCVWTGYYFHYFLSGGRIDEASHPAKSWIIHAIWGLIAIALVSQVLALSIPVNAYTWMAFAGIIILLSTMHKRCFREFIRWSGNQIASDKIVAVLSILIAVPVMVLTAGPTLMDDTDSYHIQMVKWIQEYGSVPGIANLHERYGFNSSWFSLIAFFLMPDTALNYFTLLNGVISAWIAIYLVQAISAGLRNDPVRDPSSLVSLMFVFIMAIACWPMIRGNATTANYDFITTIIVIVLLNEIFFRKKSAGSHRFDAELLIWPVFLCTIRVINFPLLLLSVYVIVNQWRNDQLRKLPVPILVGFALMVPFLARNVILSGYILYPAYQADFFQVNWKVKKETVVELVRYIKYFNRVNNGFMPIEETAALRFPGWIKAWFHYLFVYDKPVVLLGLTGYLVALIRWKHFSHMGSFHTWFLATMALQLVSWFFVAPDPRFVYGPLLVGIFLIPVAFRGRISEATRKIVYFLLIFITISTVGYSILKAARDDRYRNWVKPAALPQPPLQVFRFNNIELRIPERVNGNWNPRCYATPLPCLYTIDPFLRARGATMKDGFFIERQARD